MSACCGSYGNPFVQTLFMGASVIQFSANAAWNNADGGLNVEVVEDKCQGNVRVYANGASSLSTTTGPDNFSPPPVGSPVFFYYGGFQMGGILQSWVQNDSAEGAKTYAINVSGPNKLFEGVQVILASYDGPTMGVPNLINVHGFIESSCNQCGETGFNSTYPPFYSSTKTVGGYTYANQYPTSVSDNIATDPSSPSNGVRTNTHTGMAQPLTYQPAPGWCIRSEAGWRWSQVRAALISLLSTGGAVHYRGYSYIVDLTEMPILPDEVRLNEENLSLMDIIIKICGIAGVEFFLDVIPFGSSSTCAGNLNAGPHIIKVRIGKSCIQALDQSAADMDNAICSNIDDRLNIGTISSMVNNSACMTKTSKGLELAQNVFNAFITGELRSDIWQIDQSSHMSCTHNDNIWPYWGKNPTSITPEQVGASILGQGCDDHNHPWDETKNHHFTLDVSYLGLNLPGPQTWEVTMPELRAALVGESSWQNYLCNLEPNKWRLLGLGNNEARIAEAIDNAIKHPQDKKNIWNVITPHQPGDKDDPRPSSKELMPDKKAQERHLSGYDNMEPIVDGQCSKLQPTRLVKLKMNVSKLYDYIHKYGTEYYGKQFMVKLPFICTSFAEDAPWTWGLNWQPVDSGWADGSVLGIDPTDPIRGWVLQQFRTDDGRLSAFCKFTGPRTLLLDRIDKNDYYILSENEAYVRCRVVDIVGITPTDWRAVVCLSGPVGMFPCITMPDELSLLHGIIDVNISRAQKAGGLQQLPAGFRPTLDDIKKWFFHCGGDKTPMAGFGEVLWPDAVAVTLQSKKLVYGPWYAQKGNIFSGNDNGMTKYERKTEFSPWGYGNSALMNTAGYILASSYVHDKYVIERGEVTFAGAPVGTLGRLLYNGGPIVNRIDVTIGRGDGQVTTTMVMKTWTPSYGQLGLARVAAIHRAASIAQHAETIFRKHALDLRQQVQAVQYTDRMVLFKKTIALQGTSSHDFLFGDNFADCEDESWSRGNVVSSEPRKDTHMLFPGAPSIADSFEDYYYWEPTPDDSSDTDPGAPNDDEYVPYTVTAAREPNECTDNGEDWRRRAYMQQLGMFRPMSTIDKAAAICNDDGKYLSRYDRINGPDATPIGPDDISSYLNTESHDGTKGCDLLKCNSFFYANEQVPPIYCYEDNLPITVNTLNPFLNDEYSMKPGDFTDKCGKKWYGWDSDKTLPLTPGAGTYIDAQGNIIKLGHDIEYIARDGLYPTHLSVREPSEGNTDDYSPVHWYRAIALRGPLVLAGWGYDIDNHPVPNSASNYEEWDGRATPGRCGQGDDGTPEWDKNHGPTRKFADGWLRKPHTWKVGPVDLRWDYRRKVWTAPPAMKICRAVICQWLLPDRCAGAVIYDDMMQWDKNGVAIKTETCCGKTGYKVTVWSDSLRPIPKGWHITLYYDTTKQRYQMLSHDELPILEAVLSEDLACEGCVSATVTGIAGSTCGCARNTGEDDVKYPGNHSATGDEAIIGGTEGTGGDEEGDDGPGIQSGGGGGPCNCMCKDSIKPCKCKNLDPCNAFAGLTIQLSNPLCQPICAGRRVFCWICEAEEDTQPDNTEMNPMLGDCEHECAKIKCLRGVIIQAQFHAECFIVSIDLIENTIYWNIKTDDQHITFDYTPSGNVYGTGNLYGKASGNIDANGLCTQSTQSQNPHLAAIGVVSTHGSGTKHITLSGWNNPSGYIDWSNTIPINLGGASGYCIKPAQTVYLDVDGSSIFNGIQQTADVKIPDLVVSGSVRVKSTGNLPNLTGSCTLTDNGKIFIPVEGSSIFHGTPADIKIPPLDVWASGSISCTGTIPSLTGSCVVGPKTIPVTIYGSSIFHGISNSIFGSSGLSFMPSGTITSNYWGSGDIPSLTGTIKTAPKYVTLNGYAGLHGKTLSGLASFTPSGNITNHLYATGAIPHLTGVVNINSNAQITVVGSGDLDGMDIYPKASGSVTFTPSGTIDNYLYAIGTIPRSTGTIFMYPSGAKVDIVLDHVRVTGYDTLITVMGDVNLNVDTVGTVCLPVCGTVDIPSTKVIGGLENVSLKTSADLQQAGFYFEGSTCTFDITLGLDLGVGEEHTYDICVCWRQLFIESEVGKTVCAYGGTPCNCPTDCDPDALCQPYTEWDLPCQYCGYEGYSGNVTYSGTITGSGNMSGCVPIAPIMTMEPPTTLPTPITPCTGTPSTGTPCGCP